LVRGSRFAHFRTHVLVRCVRRILFWFAHRFWLRLLPARRITHGCVCYTCCLRAFTRYSFRCGYCCGYTRVTRYVVHVARTDSRSGSRTHPPVDWLYWFAVPVYCTVAHFCVVVLCVRGYAVTDALIVTFAHRLHAVGYGRAHDTGCTALRAGFLRFTFAHAFPVGYVLCGLLIRLPFGYHAHVHVTCVTGCLRTVYRFAAHTCLHVGLITHAVRSLHGLRYAPPLRFAHARVTCQLRGCLRCWFVAYCRLHRLPQLRSHTLPTVYRSFTVVHTRVCRPLLVTHYRTCVGYWLPVCLRLTRLRTRLLRCTVTVCARGLVAVHVLRVLPDIPHAHVGSFTTFGVALPRTRLVTSIFPAFSHTFVMAVARLPDLHVLITGCITRTVGLRYAVLRLRTRLPRTLRYAVVGYVYRCVATLVHLRTWLLLWFGYVCRTPHGSRLPARFTTRLRCGSHGYVVAHYCGYAPVTRVTRLVTTLVCLFVARTFGWFTVARCRFALLPVAVYGYRGLVLHRTRYGYIYALRVLPDYTVYCYVFWITCTYRCS